MISKPSLANITFASKLFRPMVDRPRNSKTNQEFACKSHRLFLDNGIVDRNAGVNGMFHLLPVGHIALSKLTALIDEEMMNIGAQRLTLSSFCSQRLLESSGRYALMRNHLFTTTDRNQNSFCLAPTHEEPVTSLFTDKLPYGSKDLPFLLYQITTKFRDEPLARYGLLRSKEFLMKDLYSFHANESCAKRTYDLVNDAYENLFNRLELKTFKVRATSGAMGGDLSHEFHLENDCGQDQILYCHECKTGFNSEVVAQSDSPDIHSECGSQMKKLRTIEIAHTFLLGTKYSASLNASFSSGLKNEGPAHFYMACFGIGVSRLLAASVDFVVDQSGQEAELRWPKALAPYSFCVIPPKKGSKEEQAGAGYFAWDVAKSLASEFSHKKLNLLFDDRIDLTVGRRLNNAKALGCSFVIVANKTCLQDDFPKLELFSINENFCHIVSHAELFQKLRIS